MIWGFLALATSSRVFGDGYFTVIGNAAMNLLLSAATAGLTTLLVVYPFSRRSPALTSLVVKGTLAGLIAILASAPAVLSYGAVAIGFSSALAFLFFNRFSIFLKLDDPLDIVALCYWTGFWGLMMAGLFPTRFLTRRIIPNPNQNYGAFYADTGRLILTNLILACIITGWTLATTMIVLAPLRLLGLLRVPVTTELQTDAEEGEGANPVVHETIPRRGKRLFDCW